MANREDEDEQHLFTLDELEAAQAEIRSYQNLLKALPEIYERKFNERLQPVLDRQQQLLEERQLLLGRLHQHLPGELLPADACGQRDLALPPSFAPAAGTSTTITRRWGARRLWWLIGVALLGGMIGVLGSQHLGKRSGATSWVPRERMGDRLGWERQTTRGPAPAPPTPATPAKAPA